MIATFHGAFGTWMDGDMKLLAHFEDVPFSVSVVVCACHGMVWSKNSNSKRLILVR